MRIGILSDTHWSRPSQYLEELDRQLTGVDRILHAGDVVNEFVLDRLEELAPVLGVRGNCDPWDLYSRLPPRRVVELAGLRIGIFHGHEANLNDPDSILEAFAQPLDLIIHGHTHLPCQYRHRGVTIFNPGSPSQPRGNYGPSLGMLTVSEGFQLEHKVVDC